MTIDNELLWDIVRGLEIGSHAMFEGEEGGMTYVYNDRGTPREVPSIELSNTADKVRALLEA